jgi:hypothetical protein
MGPTQRRARFSLLLGATATTTAIVAATLSLLPCRAALAYVPTVTSGGALVTWRGPSKLNLASNPVNQSGLDAESVRAAAVRSLQRWSVASGGSFGFDFWQGANPAVYTPNGEYNGLSSLYFASSSGEDLSPNVLGLTQVWYDPASGRILETDVVLNDRAFRFTTDPRDTSGFGSGSQGTRQGMNRVFIENVLTHELGHALGLSHSGGLQSAMLFMESPEQAHLGCDEQAGIRHLYPAGDAGRRGEITGLVLSEAGRPVFGAHVVAISRRRGTAMATGITDPGGRYRIAGLEPGSYFLMVEPYFAGPTALPAYYAGINGAICGGGGDEFVRGFLSDGGGYAPIAIDVLPGRATGAPSWVAPCGSGSLRGASVSTLEAASSQASAPTAYAGSGSGFGVTWRFSSQAPAYFRLKGLSGRVELHAVGYSLYSPVQASLRLLSESSGREVESARVTEPVYEGRSGYVNYDSALIAEGLEPGDYVLEVSPDVLPVNKYPAGGLALDAAPFLLVTGSVNEGAPALAPVIAENARCRMDENFAAYSSPPGDPPRGITEEPEESGGFCGTTTLDSGRKGGGSGPGAGALLGWFLPWVAMLVLARYAKARLRASRRRHLLADGHAAGVPLAFFPNPY